MTGHERRRLEQWLCTTFVRDQVVLTLPLLRWCADVVLQRAVTEGEACEFLVWANTPHYPARQVH